MTPNENRESLRRLCSERGASDFGVARLSALRTDDFLLPASLLESLPFALSIAHPLSRTVLATIEDRPNQLYEHHYRQVNFALDRLALELAEEIQALGGEALPIPASQIVDWEKQRGHLSHKRVAVAAGLGWLGRNNLLVTPTHGAQVRLVTLLTNLPLEADRPLDRDCGDCRECLAACPAGAVAERPEQFNHQACFAMLKEFQRRRYVSHFICGPCLRACSGLAKGGSGTPGRPRPAD